MEITNTILKPQTAIKSASTQGQKASEANANDIAGQQETSTSLSVDNNTKVDGDIVNLSADSLQLAKSATQQGAANLPPIGNKDQAQGVVAKIVSDIRNYPNLAVSAHGNLASLNFKALLG